MLLKIVTVPNPILSSPTQPVKKIDQSIKKIVANMIETLEAQSDPQGVGLAANQVGKKLSLFIIKPSEKAKIKVFINPKILKIQNPNNKSIPNSKTKKKKKQPVKLEGCLSIPRIWGPVKRAKKVFLQYQDINGNTHKQWFDGFIATIIQHEMDHLNGILFTKRTIEQKMPLYEEKGGKLIKLEY